MFGLLAVLPLLVWLLSLCWQVPPGTARVSGAAAAAAAGPGAAPTAHSRSPLLARELWPLTAAIVLMALSFVLGAWLGLAQPMTQSLLHHSVPEHRVGEALGARLALVGTAQAASPLVFGFGAQMLGTGPTLALAGLVLVASGVYVARAPKAS
ncbi:MAG: hypothetical protein JNJ89_04745 [Rubrivivax sp.]|nr:hypothetical protein [Rubrivivax sp.]